MEELKRAVTNNGYGDCPDLARLIAGRVGPGLVLEVGRVKARCSAGGRRAGAEVVNWPRRLVRGCPWPRSAVEQPRGWAGSTAARGPGCSGARLGPVVHGSGCRDPLVGCGPGWSIWSRCIRVSDTGYFWWRPRGGGESTPVRRSRAWTRVGRVGSRRGAGWRHPVSGRQVYAALRPPVGQPYQ